MHIGSDENSLTPRRDFRKRGSRKGKRSAIRRLGKRKHYELCKPPVSPWASLKARLRRGGFAVATDSQADAQEPFLLEWGVALQDALLSERDLNERIRIKRGLP